MNTTTTRYEHIVTNPRVCGGRPCIAGHRIRVWDIASDYEEAGLSPDEICDAHPGLSLGQVHAALAYYFDYRDEITAEINADRRFAAEFKSQNPRYRTVASMLTGFADLSMRRR